jgi:hypothetical protein
MTTTMSTTATYLVDAGTYATHGDWEIDTDWTNGSPVTFDGLLAVIAEWDGEIISVDEAALTVWADLPGVDGEPTEVEFTLRPTN